MCRADMWNECYLLHPAAFPFITCFYLFFNFCVCVPNDQVEFLQPQTNTGSKSMIEKLSNRFAKIINCSEVYRMNCKREVIQFV